MRLVALAVAGIAVFAGQGTAQPLITTVAGSGVADFCGDNGPATAACLRGPQAVAVTADGELLIADALNHRIRKVDAAGVITTIAGNGTRGFCGDGGPATDACLNTPMHLILDAGGDVLIADTGNHRIRRVDAAGTITTVPVATGAGSGRKLVYPFSVAVDDAGDLLIAEPTEHRVSRLDLAGTLTTVAGRADPDAPFCGDGGRATAACLRYPLGVAVDAAGDLLIADTNNHRVRKVDALGKISTVAGNGSPRFCGDGGPATAACLNLPAGVAFGADGSLFVADAYNHRVRRVGTTLWLNAPATPLVVGGDNTVTGMGFTPGSVVKLSVAGANPPVDHPPLTPHASRATSLSFWIPSSVELGRGFCSLKVVNTDAGSVESNIVGALLEGHPAGPVPTILYINATPLGPADPRIGLAHADVVVLPGNRVRIIGTGFNLTPPPPDWGFDGVEIGPAVNLYTAAGNVGPLWPRRGATATQIEVEVPATAPPGPGTFQVVNSPFDPAVANVESNAVAAVIGERPTIDRVVVSGTTVTVTGAGFCTASVVNLFNRQGGASVNLGGFTTGGGPRLPLTLVSDTELRFVRPADAVAGPAFVVVINPPFIPFASTGSDPDGAFTLP